MDMQNIATGFFHRQVDPGWLRSDLSSNLRKFEERVGIQNNRLRKLRRDDNENGTGMLVNDGRQHAQSRVARYKMLLKALDSNTRSEALDEYVKELIRIGTLVVQSSDSQPANGTRRELNDVVNGQSNMEARNRSGGSMKESASGNTVSKPEAAASNMTRPFQTETTPRPATKSAPFSTTTHRRPGQARREFSRGKSRSNPVTFDGSEDVFQEKHKMGNKQDENERIGVNPYRIKRDNATAFVDDDADTSSLFYPSVDDPATSDPILDASSGEYPRKKKKKKLFNQTLEPLDHWMVGLFAS